MIQLRSAIAYAERFGWPVFPLVPGDKLPLISRKRGGRGVLDATTDLDTISRWWRSCPTANIGLALGGGIFAVDVDPRNEGDASLAELLSKHGTLPDTVTACTGGGGLHIILRGEVGGTVLADGVDIKSTGGYIVAPPSIHPNGQRYLWEVSSRPGEVGIADAPGWLLGLLGVKRMRQHFAHADSIEPESFVLGAAFKAAGWLGHELRPGVFAALCPNRAAHTGGHDFDSSTVVFAPVPGKRRGRFYCSHEHCREVWR